MTLFETERLTVRRFVREDAPFVLALLTDPGFVANIADRGVRDEAGACRYIEERMLAAYATHGYGMFRVALREGDVPVGMVGLVRREGLDAPDLGFAYLEAHTRRGYGLEAGVAMLAACHAIRPLLAVTKVENAASAALLGRLGFVEDGRVALPGHSDESRLFALS